MLRLTSKSLSNTGQDNSLLNLAVHVNVTDEWLGHRRLLEETLG